MTSSSDKTSSQVHVLAEGLTFEWLNGQVASYVLTTMSQKTIDTYFEVLESLIKAHADESLCLLADVGQAGLPSVYYRNKLQDFSQVLTQTEFKGKVAVVIPAGLASSLYLGFVRVFGKTSVLNTGTSLFQDRDKALKWLMG